MNIHQDFEEFLRLFAEKGVEFVVVGGYAVAFHGYVRATQDIGVFVRASESNARKVLCALRDFGISADESVLDDLCDPGSVLRLGHPPARIEIMNSISGLSFDEVWERRLSGRYGDAEVSYISRRDLLENERAAGRPKDLADFDELGVNRSNQ